MNVIALTDSDLARFHNKVDQSGDCWVWTASCTKGYGRFRVGDRRHLAHRIAWIAANGPIPDGLTVDHLCFNPLCVRPSHLQLLPHEGNARNQRSASVTHCVNGHEFTPENTYHRPARPGEGSRDCRACIRKRASEYRARKRMAVAA